MQGLLLFAPTLKWMVGRCLAFGVFAVCAAAAVRFEMELAERDPYGIKDERVRRLVVRACGRD